MKGPTEAKVTETRRVAGAAGQTADMHIEDQETDLLWRDCREGHPGRDADEPPAFARLTREELPPGIK